MHMSQRRLRAPETARLRGLVLFALRRNASPCPLRSLLSPYSRLGHDLDEDEGEEEVDHATEP